MTKTAKTKLPKRFSNVIETLDGGGMSELLVCRDSHLDRDVVVKALKSGVDEKRLLDEIAALSSIRSKHVVQIYDVIRDGAGKVTAIVEEYLTGDSLDEIASPSSASQALELLHPIAAGIKDIHAHGRVHRDLKPNNMKKDANGCIKIFDFGLAKMEAKAGGTKSLYFTPGYTAPEAFVVNAAGKYEFTTAVDVFAFGATAFSLLSDGKLPKGFSKMPPVVDGADFAKLPQSLPAAVASILNDCVAEAPAARPSMSKVTRVLANYLLFDRHRATLIYGAAYALDAKNRQVTIEHNKEVKVAIEYNGLAFRVRSVSGPVYINNILVAQGFELPGACVVVMGDPAFPGLRSVIPIAVSHPEVTL